MRRIFVIALLLILFIPTQSSADSPQIYLIRVEGVINPVTSEFILKSILKAEKEGFTAIIIELDTPGGLDTSMRSIIKAINGSSIPVIVYVAPSGARAASAGVFITMAAHVAAMAPGTNIGAAHPVGMGGKMDKTMVEKATNDAVAYIKSIAQRRGRNQKWAEDAVRKSVSITAQEALNKKVVDLIAENRDDLLAKLDGIEVETVSGKVMIKGKGATIVEGRMGTRLKILGMISDPNVAYILMLLGFYGLFFELTNPGAIFPGVIGGICLILAFYSFQTLPVNYAGLLLIILAIIMFVLEVKIASHGVLTIGGIVAMIIGSLMLFESPGPFVKLSLALIIPAVLVTAAFFTITIGLAFKAWRRKPVTGTEGLVGLAGVAHTDIGEDGMALVRGEYWQAFSDEPIARGDKIMVESVDGLKIKVKPLKKEEG